MDEPQPQRPQIDQVDGKTDVYIAAVGASAGGLEALEAFFEHMPVDSGMAFVVIQHLSPDFKSHMDELLARKTQIPVLSAEDGVRVQPNHIYLLPARKDMAITDGRLRLTERIPGSSFSHPIDQFFQSMARDCGHRAIAIVLSGTGSDGSKGILDVHRSGGLTIAQNEATAKFDGMPISAQETGVIDLVLTPDAMADTLVRYTRDGVTREDLAQPELSFAGIDGIFQQLRQQYGIDFTQYNTTTIGRRLQRRLDRLSMKSLDAYREYLAENRAELAELYRDLLISVTQFFRDPDAYQVLAETAIEKLFCDAPPNQIVRAWVAGCATGEEAYSIAMMLDEERRRRKANVEIKVFATDVQPSSVQFAARGVYSAEAMESVPERYRQRYFRRVGDHHQVVPELRRLVVFAPHNMLSDAPFTQMDLVTCRNALIYFQPRAQAKALALLHYSLKTGGTLFLGPSESTGDLSDEFQVANHHWRIFTKRRNLRMPIGTEVPLTPRNATSGLTVSTTTSGGMRVDGTLVKMYDELLDQKLGDSLLVDRRGRILHVFGDAARYLRYSSGRPSDQVLDVVDDQVRSSLSAAIHHASNRGRAVRYSAIPIKGIDSVDHVQLAVEPIGDPVSGSGNLLISVIRVDYGDHQLVRPVGATTDGDSATQSERGDIPRADKSLDDAKAERLTHLESQLQQSQENLQATIEEMEASNEELQASNEELVASNEELQSTNEELHSVNEELHTVNAEHQRRVEELAEANADMDNLLATTQVGVVFLDQDLAIRRYTPKIAEILELSENDIGRPITAFASKLGNVDLLSDLRSAMTTQQPQEKKVEVPSGHSFLLRSVPYRSNDQVVGVVLTMIDITSLRAAELLLERFKFMTEKALDLIFLADRNGKILYANESMAESLGYPRDELLQKHLGEIHTDLTEDCYAEWLASAIQQSTKPFEANWTCSDGTELPVEISLSSIRIQDQDYLCGSVRDIRERRAAELEMRLQRLAIESTSNGIIISDAGRDDHPITYANPGFLKLTGYERDEVVGRNCRFLQGEATAPEHVAELREAIDNGQPCRVAIRNYRKDGSAFWNDLQVTPVHDAQDRLVNFVGVQNDITDRIEVQKALERANREVKAISDAKSSFMANMSHELRTPMTAVLGFADMLIDDLCEEELLEKVYTIKRNGEYLLALLNDILDLSKIEAGQMEIQREELSIRHVVSDIESLMEVRATEEGIPLEFVWQPDAPATVTADQTRMRQVIVNLVGNALKFTDEGQVRVVIGTNGEASPPELAIAVHDTGIGIHESHLPDLFTPFNVSGVTRRRRFGGTGLGLSISKRLAEGMGGRIEVDSELGVGSCFTFYLPLTESQAGNCESSATTPAESAATTAHRPTFPKFDARILLADDRRDIWRIGKYFLEKCGAKVTVVEDGLQAVEEVQRAAKHDRPFDLILMDMQMPVMTGREAVSELRDLGVTIPIIALTADAMDGEREACIEMGCDDYFPKPIDGLKLMNLVDYHLQHDVSSNTTDRSGIID